MAMRQEANWILNNEVLGLDLLDTVASYSVEQDQIIDTIHQIAYQLEERIPFSPENDLVLVNILLELGELLETHVSIENAYVAYKMASHYDPENLLNAAVKVQNILPLFLKYDFDTAVYTQHFPPKKMFDQGLNENSSTIFFNMIQALLYWPYIIGILVLLVLFIRLRRKSRKRMKLRTNRMS